MTRIPPPPPAEPVVDLKTGRLTQAWYHYFAQPDDLAKGFFHVTLNSTNATVPLGDNTTAAKIPFNYEVFDTNAWFDSTNASFTPSEQGYYQFTVSAYSSLTKSGYSPELFITRNSSAEIYGDWVNPLSTATGASVMSVSGMLYMNGSGDTAKFCIYSPSTTVNGSPNITYAFGYKIGQT